MNRRRRYRVERELDLGIGLPLRWVILDAHDGTYLASLPSWDNAMLLVRWMVFRDR